MIPTKLLIPPSHSLVKYCDVEVLDDLGIVETPRHEIHTEGSTKKKGKENPEEGTQLLEFSMIVQPSAELVEAVATSGGEAPVVGHISSFLRNLKPSRTLEEVVEVLNCIFPPVYYIRHSDGHRILCRQRISWAPASRLEINLLRVEFNKRLQQRQARQRGLCPIRRELYNQLMDELIRQITINCAERGLLLLRVRDEIRMTIACFRSVLDAGVRMGIQLSAKAERDCANLVAEIARIEIELVKLRSEKSMWLRRVQTLEDAMQKDMYVMHKKQEDDANELKKLGDNLKTQIDMILSLMELVTKTSV